MKSIFYILRYVVLGALVGALILAFAVPVMAAPITAETVSDVPVTPAEALQMLILTLSSVAAAFMSAPLTTVLVNLAKRFPFTDSIPGNTLRLVFATLLTIVFWIAKGLEGDTGVQMFNDVSNVLVVGGPFLVNLLLNIIGSSKIYSAVLAEGGDPLFAYQRSDPTAPLTITLDGSNLTNLQQEAFNWTPGSNANR